MAGHAYTAAAGRGVTRRGEDPGPAAPMFAAAACLVAMAFVWTVAELVPAGRVRDAALLGDFVRQNNSAAREEVANFLIHLLEPSRFIVWAAIVVAVALVRQRAWLALAVAAAMGLAPLTAEILKPLLARTHLGAGATQIGAASWPSGHATAAAVLVLCAILVSPPRARPIVALIGGMYVLAVAVSLVVLAWHMPSDVIGGLLVAALWTSLALAAVRAVTRRRDRAAPA